MSHSQRVVTLLATVMFVVLCAVIMLESDTSMDATHDALDNDELMFNTERALLSTMAMQAYNNSSSSNNSSNSSGTSTAMRRATAGVIVVVPRVTTKSRRTTHVQHHNGHRSSSNNTHTTAKTLLVLSDAYREQLLQGYRYALLVGAPWLLLVGSAADVAMAQRFLATLREPGHTLFSDSVIRRLPQSLHRLATALRHYIDDTNTTQQQQQQQQQHTLGRWVRLHSRVIPFLSSAHNVGEATAAEAAVNNTYNKHDGGGDKRHNAYDEAAMLHDGIDEGDAEGLVHTLASHALATQQEQQQQSPSSLLRRARNATSDATDGDDDDDDEVWLMSSSSSSLSSDEDNNNNNNTHTTQGAMTRRGQYVDDSVRSDVAAMQQTRLGRLPRASFVLPALVVRIEDDADARLRVAVTMLRERMQAAAWRRWQLSRNNSSSNNSNDDNNTSIRSEQTTTRATSTHKDGSNNNDAAAAAVSSSSLLTRMRRWLTPWAVYTSHVDNKDTTHARAAAEQWWLLTQPHAIIVVDEHANLVRSCMRARYVLRDVAAAAAARLRGRLRRRVQYHMCSEEVAAHGGGVRAQVCDDVHAARMVDAVVPATLSRNFARVYMVHRYELLSPRRPQTNAPAAHSGHTRVHGSDKVTSATTTATVTTAKAATAATAATVATTVAATMAAWARRLRAWLWSWWLPFDGVLPKGALLSQSSWATRQLCVYSYYLYRLHHRCVDMLRALVSVDGAIADVMLLSHLLASDMAAGRVQLRDLFYRS